MIISLSWFPRKNRLRKHLNILNSRDYFFCCCFFLGTRCVICQMDYKRGDRQMILPCKHVYHAGCVTRWLGINKVSEININQRMQAPCLSWKFSVYSWPYLSCRLARFALLRFLVRNPDTSDAWWEKTLEKFSAYYHSFKLHLSLNV